MLENCTQNDSTEKWERKMLLATLKTGIIFCLFSALGRDKVISSRVSHELKKKNFLSDEAS